MDKALKKCKCGNKKLEIHKLPVFAKRFCILCECGNKTIYYDTKAEAIKAWNKRTD